MFWSKYLIALVLASPLMGIAQDRFDVSVDGSEVFDRNTNLIWKRCVEGEKWDKSTCVGGAGKFTYGEAMGIAKDNPSGWRLPAIKELFSIAGSAQASKVVPWAENAGTVFWASTPNAAVPAMLAWSVDVVSATTLPMLQGASNLVRMVRSAKSSLSNASFPNDRGVMFKEVVAPLGHPYARTECVFDRATGLTWEGKPVDGGFRDASQRYTNFDNPDQLQALVANVPNRPITSQIVAQSNAIAYIKAVNAAQLCGFADWRLPTMAELHDLVNFESSRPPMLNAEWFPNTPAQFFYWTSEAHPTVSTSARILNLSIGAARATSRATPGYIRLVR